MNKLNILLVDDDNNFAKAFELLARKRFNLSRVATGEQAVELIQQKLPDAILLDLQLGAGIDGLETLHRINELNFDIPVIMITEHASPETAVKAMRMGALNYMAKNPNMRELETIIERELQHIRWKKLYQKSGSDFDPIIGTSKPIKELKRLIGKAAKSDMSIILEGENGVGKELAARMIHEQGNHSDKPFVPINCSAVQNSLFESEFFGHEKGAFTGAIRQKKGLFELADGSVLFLDEIANLDYNMQGKLLRVLEDGSFRRVGGEQLITVDVRVLAATNKSLEQEVEEGRFRQDLYYRLNVITIEIPPLRRHKDDIYELVNYFISTFPNAEKSAIQFSKSALQKLEKFHWPGNIRELKNVVYRALAMSSGNEIQSTDVLFHTNHISSPQIFQDVLSMPYSQARDHIITEFKKYYLRELLNRHCWNIAQAAQEAGLPRPSLHRMMKDLGLTPEAHSKH
jgi:DNA-binding NtrC family response regulator